MESIELLKSNVLSIKEWLTYYQNIWLKNCVARTIDVKSDTLLSEKDPETLVTEYDTEYGQPTGKEIPVKDRLAVRKMMLADAYKIYESIKALIDEHDNAGINFVDKYFTQVTDKIVEPKAEEPASPEQPSAEAKVE